VVSSPSWLPALADTLGVERVARRLGTGAWLAEGDGRRLVVKTGPGVADEARGLRLLAAAGAPPVPPVVLEQGDLLVTAWVEQAGRGPGHDAALGADLARLHRTSAGGWGGGSSWIGDCPVDPTPAPDAVSFYGRRLMQLARRCRLEDRVGRLAGRLPGLLPEGGPALVHGDLWWGNVLWGADGRAWLIDPSVHGGHPEEDLAMLALFGAVPERTYRAYENVTPLADGWKERVPLWQLYPLLVHTVLFGGGYRARAESVLARLGA
jgi:fructosamine-3-kinase